MVMLSKIMNSYGGSRFAEAVALAGMSNLEDFSDRMYKRFCEKFSNASYMLNVEWVLRHFLASKKMLLSSLLYMQTIELSGKGMKNISFYSSYYCLFNALLSNLTLIPELSVKQVKKISHSQVFNFVDDQFNKFELYGKDLNDLLNDLRLTRELYSYHLPLDGSFAKNGMSLNGDVLFSRLSQKLKPILQITNLISFISYLAWDKKVGVAIDEYEKYQVEEQSLFFSLIEQQDFLGTKVIIDDGDYYRQGYMLSKGKVPFPISWTMSEKICDDLESGWECHESTEDANVTEMFDITKVTDFLVETLE